MSRLNSNVFAIGRKKGDENQLTALLGALFRREPGSRDRFLEKLGLEVPAEGDWSVDVEHVHARGRFDLVLKQPGTAFIVVESKIDADLGMDQVCRYLKRLAGRNDECRALVFLTRKEPLLTDPPKAFAARHGIEMRCARWQDLAECLADPEVESLAGDFAELLVSEDLASPPAVDADDWLALHGAPRAFTRLERLLGAAAQRVVGTGLMAKASRPQSSRQRRVVSNLEKGTLRLRIGVAASDGTQRPDTLPTVWVGITDEAVAEKDRRKWAEDGAKIVGGEADRRWITRRQAAAQLLGEKSFDGQVEALAGFATELFHDAARLAPARKPIEPSPD